MTARHYQSVLLFWQAYQAFGFRVARVISDGLISLCCFFFISHTIDWFDLKWQSIDEYDLLLDVCSVDSSVAVLAECCVTHHCKLLLPVRVVHRNNQRVVFLYWLGELKRGKIIQVECDLLKRDFLSHSRLTADLLDVVLSVWCVEHFRSVIGILLLCYACVYPDVRVAECINFEWKLELMVIGNSLNAHVTLDYKEKKMIIDKEKVEFYFISDNLNLQLSGYLCAHKPSCRSFLGHHSVLKLLFLQPPFGWRFFSTIDTSYCILARFADLAAACIMACTTATASAAVDYNYEFGLGFQEQVDAVVPL